MKLFSRFFIALLLLSFLLRILIMFWSFNFRENTDVLRFRDWARIAHVYGLKDAYKSGHLQFGTLVNNMPPGSLYFNVAAYETQISLVKIYLRITNQEPGSNLWINSYLINIFLRLPAIIADLAIGLLIYRWVKSKNKEKSSILASSLFLFNPVVLYNSAFWGQMDSLYALPLLIAFYLLSKKQYFWSILAFSFSLYVKLNALFFLPFFLIITYKLIKNKVAFLTHIILSFFVIYALTIPVSATPLTFISNLFLKTSSGEMQNVTNFAFNFWWFLLKPFIAIGEPKTLFNFSEIRLLGSPLSSTSYFGLQLTIWAFLIFSLALIPVILKITFLKREKILHPQTLLLFSLIAILGFIFLPRMHERYMYPLFPLFATYVGLKQKFLFIFIILSFLNFINLYLVWHPMMLFFMPYEIMNNQWFQWLISGSITATGIIFYIRSLKLLRNEEN